MTMRASKKARLEAQGWKVGSAEEFLELAPEEAAYIEMKLALGDSLKRQRLKRKMSQVELARAVKSRQSRIAKMEAGDPSVSIDLLLKSLLALGASPKQLGKTISITRGE